MTAVEVLTEVLAKGGKVVWDPPDKPRLLAPPSLHEAIRGDRETIREILRRATVFRSQVQQPGPWVPLALPGAPNLRDGCLSCGVPLDPGRTWRCEVCALAVALALESK